MIDEAVDKLACYAQRTGLVDPCERIWAVNAILEALKLDSYTQPTGSPEGEIDLPAVLEELMDDAHARGVLPEDSVVYRDLFDTMPDGTAHPPGPRRSLSGSGRSTQKARSVPPTGITGSARIPTISAGIGSQRM